VKLLEDGELVPYELILEGRMNPYIGLGLCEETLGNLDSAAEWFSKAEGAYQRLLDSRKDVRDYVSLLSDWKNAAILCGSMRKKVELKRDGATTSKGDEYLNSFFELAEGTWGVPFGLFEEDLHEFCWSTEEEVFVRKLREDDSM
jgi:hypothetical protein